VPTIAARKTSTESSSRAIQGGELERAKKEVERMTALVKSLEELKVSLEKEYKLLKQRDLEKENIITKMS